MLSTQSKIPVVRTALECYRVTAQHLRDFVRIAGVWLIVLLVVSAALYWVLYPIEQADTAGNYAGSELVTYLMLSVSSAIGAAIAVPWHRTLLLGEAPHVATAYNTIPRTLKYAAIAILMMAPTMLPMTAVMLNIPPETDVTGSQADAMALAIPLALIVGLAATLVTSRLSLILPPLRLAMTALD